jgi:hypothetical protein
MISLGSSPASFMHFFCAFFLWTMEKEKLSTCRGEGSAVGPLLATLRC